MGSKAHDILGPLDASAMRVVFLYVGQGESTLLLVPDGNGGHLSVLVDCNRSETHGGIDLARLLQDLLPKASDGELRRLDYFINTHPHKDHLGGLDSIREVADVANVWHSGHTPGKEHDGPYQELRSLMRATEKAGGGVVELTGSRTASTIGKAQVHVLAPAAHVTDDIQGEDAAARYQRIHEQCAVLRFGYGNPAARVLVTGDSDKTAWKDHIAYHHAKDEENRVVSDVLSASHHGSRTFFKHSADDDQPYKEHLVAIAPTYLVISAPDADDSPHEHPHDDALDLYRERVEADRILHMGSTGQSFVLDIEAGGDYDIRSDRGELAGAFGFVKPGKGGGNDSGKRASVVEVISRVERSRPMG